MEEGPPFRALGLSLGSVLLFLRAAVAHELGVPARIETRADTLASPSPPPSSAQRPADSPTSLITISPSPSPARSPSAF